MATLDTLQDDERVAELDEAIRKAVKESAGAESSSEPEDEGKT